MDAIKDHLGDKCVVAEIRSGLKPPKVPKKVSSPLLDEKLETKKENNKSKKKKTAKNSPLNAPTAICGGSVPEKVSKGIRSGWMCFFGLSRQL